MGECRCCSRRRPTPPLLPAIGSCGLGVGPSRIRTPARPSRRSIGGQGLRGCLRSSHPAKSGVCEGPPQFLLLRRHRFRPRLSCYRGSREEAFSYPPLCWLDTARQFSAPGKVILDKSQARSQCPTGELQCSRACPLYPQKRTLPDDGWMSALCQKRTSGHSYSISWSARDSSVRRCAGFCAAVRPMCRFLSVLRSPFVLYVRIVELEKIRLYSYLPNHWGIVQR